jgi:hypothetical protein
MAFVHLIENEVLNDVEGFLSKTFAAEREARRAAF